MRDARPFTLIWGDDEPEGAPMDVWDMDNSSAVPDKWSLANFFSPLVLPGDIFDLRHFQCAGMADFFLQRDAKKNDHSDTPQKEAEEDAEPDPAHPAMQAPAILYPLRVLLMSLKRIPDEFEDESVRRHVLGRFGSAIPVHRIAVLVATS
eukprot:symbB.v1.2.027670.t1/scaffold2857.1/size68730/1